MYSFYCSTVTVVSFRVKEIPKAKEREVMLYML
jgi:hypothetical protein